MANCKILFYFVTVTASRSSEARHVAVANIVLPLLHARAVIGAHIVSALLARMQAGVNVASGRDEGTRHDGIGDEIGALPAEIQRRQAPLEPVTAENLFRQLAVLRLLHSTWK